jgi:hypothetical protein
MEQLLLHLFGDYVTQSEWMATNKTKSVVPAVCHAIVYSLPFLLLRPSWIAFAAICGTHFVIDHWRLARHVIWLKNVVLAPPSQADEQVRHEDGSYAPVYKYSWQNCATTGYPDQTPTWLAVWLMIIADNTMHLTINYFALKYL